MFLHGTIVFDCSVEYWPSAALILWLTLPFRSTLPPFLLTALLALGYGVYCLGPRHRPGDKKH